MNHIELGETVNLMISSDYKKRFLAEYLQLKVRLSKLESMIVAWDNGKLDFTPTCPREIYDKQIKSMGEYLDILVERAKIENIEL